MAWNSSLAGSGHLSACVFSHPLAHPQLIHRVCVWGGGGGGGGCGMRRP